MVSYLDFEKSLSEIEGKIRELNEIRLSSDDNNVSIDDISKLEIPTGNPLLIEFEKGIVKNARYLDKERAQDLINF